MRRLLPFVALVISAACGGATPEPASPVVDAEAEATRAAAADVAPAAPAVARPSVDVARPVTELPTECAEHKDNLCLPPAPFVKRLCTAPYPNVALTMFHKTTPWTRAYLRMNVEAWNASGGLSASDKLVFDEEVLVLHKRVAAARGIQVSGSSGAGYEVLRWDGSCASLNEEELTFKAPPSKAKFARINYRALDEAIRTALEANEKVGKAVEDRRKECQGASMGSDPGPKCAKAEEMVSGVVVDYVRAGGTLPAPTRLP